MTRQGIKVGRRILCNAKGGITVWGLVLAVKGKGPYSEVAVRFEQPEFNDEELMCRVLYQCALKAAMA